MRHLADQLRHHASSLALAGIESPRADAELIAAHVLGVPRGKLLLVDMVTDVQAASMRELVARRAERVPLQHLTGVAPFMGLELAVGPGVFIPRPETELLAEWGIGALDGLVEPVVVDLCSGSGALALAIAQHRPDATVYAVERSPDALKWLRHNASGTGVTIVEGDIRDAGLPVGVDLVVCNPPYVPGDQQVAAEVAADPAEAVFAGDDGLELIPAVIERAQTVLRAGGRLGIEHDESHDLAALLAAAFTGVARHVDLAGRPRFTTGTRKDMTG